MLITVTGGSGSGKSKIAEDIIQFLVPGEKAYLATMQCMDQETVRRIEKHRKMRSGRHFVTVEQECALTKATLPAAGEKGILLECMSNLVANEMYAEASEAKELPEEDLASYIVDEIRWLKNQTEHLVIVTNDVFGEIPAYAETDRYLRIFGRVNRALAEDSDTFLEVVYGLPVWLKKKEGTENSLLFLCAESCYNS